MIRMGLYIKITTSTGNDYCIAVVIVNYVSNSSEKALLRDKINI